MTLHEAIERILQEEGIPMTSSKLADMVNERNLYKRQDGLPVSASQVTSRVNNYNKIFIKENGEVKLVKNDLISQEFRKYRNQLVHSYQSNPQTRKSNAIEVFLEILVQIFEIESSLKDNIRGDTDSYSHYSLNRYEKFKIAYKLCDWFFKQNRDISVYFSDQLASIISGMAWFNNSINVLRVDYDGFHYFLLKLVSENPKSIFKIDKEKTGSSKRHSRAIDLNRRVSGWVNGDIYNTLTNSNAIETGIFVPQFRKNINDTEKTEFDGILSELENLEPTLDRAILLVANTALNKTSKKFIETRRKIVESNSLESVISFNNGMIQNTSLNLSMLVFDFRKRNKSIFFYDATENLSEDNGKAIKVINNKEAISDFSISLSVEQIESVSFSLDPKRYTFNPKEIEIKPGFIKYTIKKLCLEDKSGVRFKNRNSIYVGGEYKLIRTSEIDKDSLYFEPNESMLGIDHDELDNTKKYFVSGGLVISGFNKKIKSSILSRGETYVLGQDVYWIKPNEDLVIEEYLIQELHKPYVAKQVEYYSKGAAIARLSKKDFLNIEVQIPSLEVQKDILVKMYRKTEPKLQSNVVSNNELDFIKTLKHSLKQPAAAIGNDLASLIAFLKTKAHNGEPIGEQENIVPVFDTDTPEQIEMHLLSNTLDRMVRAVTDIDYILEQALLIIAAGSSPIKTNIELKPFLTNIKAENPEITINVTGKSFAILADRKQLRILINNFVENAKRHGFIKGIEFPTIWLEIKSKNTISIQISIRNNGKSLPPEFTIEDFLAKGASTKEDVGSGFGGFLIGQILNNHQGTVELVETPQFGLLPHNVEFLITLPK